MTGIQHTYKGLHYILSGLINNKEQSDSVSEEPLQADLQERRLSPKCFVRVCSVATLLDVVVSGELTVPFTRNIFKRETG